MMRARLSWAAAIGCGLTAALPGRAAAQPVPSRAAPDRFEINAFDVSGVTKLDTITVERAVYPFAGPGRAATDVEAARKALEDAYKARGFESVLVEIPPQPNDAFTAGVVQLKVTEAAIGRLRVTGAKYHAPSIVLAQLPSLREGEVPDLKQAQVELAAANRFPDREVVPAIKPGRVPGTIDVDLRVDDKLPLHGNVTLNNDHASATTPLRLGASIRYANLFQEGHTLNFAWQGSPQDVGESRVISGSYLAPIRGSRWSVLAFGYGSNSNVAAIGGTQVLGNGYSIGARAVYRLPDGRFSQSISFGLDYKDFLEDITVPSTEPTVPPTTIKTPIAYVPLTGSYTVQHATENSTMSLTVGLTMGLRQLASDEAVIKTKRLNAVGNFVRLNFDADYNRAFAGDWLAVVRANGQLADTPLVTNEQFATGGASSVRGYFLAEAVGDSGVSGSLELRSPSLAGKLGRYVDELRLFAFADGGYVRVLSPLPEQRDRFTLVSLGGGARFALLKYFTGNLGYGIALNRGSVTPAGDGQFIFSLEAAF